MLHAVDNKTSTAATTKISKNKLNEIKGNFVSQALQSFRLIFFSESCFIYSLIEQKQDFQFNKC